jgi:hypothetical protein
MIIRAVRLADFDGGRFPPAAPRQLRCDDPDEREAPDMAEVLPAG